MIKKLIVGISFISFCISLCAQASYSNNEDEQYEDMLTPQYYNTPDGGDFRLELNEFVHFARIIPFQHPLQSPSGDLAAYTIKRGFGAGIGSGGTGSHHPAIDYYLNDDDSVSLYAACDGYVSIDKTVSRYRHFLSISSDVKDSTEVVIGKMLVIYAHIELDLDAADSLNLEGKYVKKGDLISKHLYSGTVGGPHLHFEIRYYRASDAGDEDFYGGQVGDKTSPSAGSWSYGYWNPDIGYGYGHPFNHLKENTTAIAENDHQNTTKIYPNPVNDFLTIELEQPLIDGTVTISTIQGREIYRDVVKEDNKKLSIDFRDYAAGVYLVNSRNDGTDITTKVIKE